MFAERLQKNQNRVEVAASSGFGIWWKEAQQNLEYDEISFFLNKSVVGREHRELDECGFPFPYVLHVCNSLL